MLHHEAAVLDDADARAGQGLGGLPGVRPPGSWSQTTCGFAARMSGTWVRDVNRGRRKTLTMSIGPRDRGEAAIDAAPENLDHVRVVHGHRDDVILVPQHVLRHVVRGRAGAGDSGLIPSTAIRRHSRTIRAKSAESVTRFARQSLTAS